MGFPTWSREGPGTAGSTTQPGGEHKQVPHRLHVQHHVREPCPHLLSLHQFPAPGVVSPKPSVKGPHTFLLRTFALAFPSFPEHFLQSLTPFTLPGFTPMSRLRKALQVTLDKIASPHSGSPPLPCLFLYSLSVLFLA